MQDLRVIGVENGALLVASGEGTKYRIPIDEVLQSKLRQAIPDPGSSRKLAPREIQAHIRSGMSAQDVASLTGVPLEYIQRFEGPVLAEREFVVNSALNVPVHNAMETDPLGNGSTFGMVIRERLYGLEATDERWASWKEVGGGWVVKLAFNAEQIERDARWRFDPKKAALSPLNNEAIALSTQGEATGSLLPRLRAVAHDEGQPDQSRFSSGAFDFGELALQETSISGGGRRETSQYGRLDDTPAAVSDAAINRAPVPDDSETRQTSDLLEALRRRRGERESASSPDEVLSPPNRSVQPSALRLLDAEPIEHADDHEDRSADTVPQPHLFQPRASVRKGRASMPSWDEIVFGARSDDDL